MAGTKFKFALYLSSNSESSGFQSCCTKSRSISVHLCSKSARLPFLILQFMKADQSTSSLQVSGILLLSRMIQRIWLTLRSSSRSRLASILAAFTSLAVLPVAIFASFSAHFELHAINTMGSGESSCQDLAFSILEIHLYATFARPEPFAIFSFVSSHHRLYSPGPLNVLNQIPSSSWTLL